MEESTQQHEQGIVAWEVPYDQSEAETKPTQNDQFILTQLHLLLVQTLISCIITRP